MDRSYHGENRPSHQHWARKHHWARSVVRWGTTCEPLVTICTFVACTYRAVVWSIGRSRVVWWAGRVRCWMGQVCLRWCVQRGRSPWRVCCPSIAHGAGTRLWLRTAYVVVTWNTAGAMLLLAWEVLVCMDGAAGLVLGRCRHTWLGPSILVM